MSLRIVTAPASLPVTLADAKAFLKITDTSQDTLVTAMLGAATNYVQAKVQRLFVTQTVEWIVQSWRPYLRLPVAPVLAEGVAWLKYVDLAGDQQTFDASLYTAWQQGHSVNIAPKLGQVWPMISPDAAEPILIRFDAGDDVDDVPAEAKIAIELAVRQMYSLQERNLFLASDLVVGVGQKTFSVSDTIDGIMAKTIDNVLAGLRWD